MNVPIVRPFENAMPLQGLAFFAPIGRIGEEGIELTPGAATNIAVIKPVIVEVQRNGNMFASHSLRDLTASDHPPKMQRRQPKTFG